MRRMRLFKFVGKVLPLAALIVGVVWAALHDQKYINPAAPAVRREAEEDWCSKKTRVTKQRCVVLFAALGYHGHHRCAESARHVRFTPKQTHAARKKKSAHV